MPIARPLCRLGLVLLALLAATPADAAAAPLDDRQRRCLTLIAYAEAAGEGSAGMAAVMHVVRNRMAHPDFPDDACAVALQDGQFQPVAEQPLLQQALVAPQGRNLAQALGAASPAARLALVEAWRLAAVIDRFRLPDTTRGALYFVNPDLMDPAKCPWFAGLKRTARIGSHVFMTELAPGERHLVPALDCAVAGRGFAKGTQVAAAYGRGPSGARGAKAAARAAAPAMTPAMIRLAQRAEALARRGAELRRRFQVDSRSVQASSSPEPIEILPLRQDQLPRLRRP